MVLNKRVFTSRKYLRLILLATFVLTFFFGFLADVFQRAADDWATRAWPGQPHSSPIPKTLWYKLGPKGLTAEARAWTNTCIGNNTDYQVRFMTDSSADMLIQEKFGATHPDLVEIYLGLNVPILKADLFRYLVLFSEGGVYSDLDVSCEVPISEWIPLRYKAEASVVVGWEFDVGWTLPFNHQFATWIIMAKPRSSHIWAVVQDIVQSLQAKMEEKNISVEELNLQTFDDVINLTGPRRFTKSLLKSMGKAKAKQVQGILEPKLAGDVLILPGYAFAASTNFYDEDIELPPPLVTHHYAGSWRNRQGGEVA
ncbi:uncharacterized protein C8A04DRAFT_39500 [Dichotomopilus funicola]|uniref:Initiation-specific alpha-1,6-mannosyltransferase n=1 Tax=Dichotomopilus funicola TaxID=1934379 RepID=A0AAN6UXF3_9PEZI|nr:hypothetical protein C8A04DRAFT_39500 [Dichotomopilus funicola]